MLIVAGNTLRGIIKERINMSQLQNCKAKIVLCCLATMLSIVSVTLLPKDAYAAQYGIDMVEACEHEYGLSMIALNTTNNVMGWNCYIVGSIGYINQGGVNLNSFCAYKYGNYKAYYRDFNDKYSWYCAPK